MENLFGRKDFKILNEDKLNIPTGKFKRTGKILNAGLKVENNYAGYYGSKLIQSETDREKLDEQNASDIMESLLELKGGGLKLLKCSAWKKAFYLKHLLINFL